MGAEGPGESRGSFARLGIQIGQSVRNADAMSDQGSANTASVGVGVAEGHVFIGHPAVGTMLVVDVAAPVGQEFGCAVQGLAGDVLHLVQHLAAGLDGGVAAHEGVLGSHGVPIVRVGLRVGFLDHFNHFDGQVQFLGSDLGNSRQSSLAVVDGADHDLDVAVA